MANQQFYGFPQPTQTVFPAPIIAQRAPTTSDTAYPIGQIWVDENGNDMYGLVDVTANSATWSVLAAQPGNVDTLTGNTGGALSPSAGNISVVGAGVLAFAGSGSTLTGSITPGTALVSTVTGNSGGALSPTAGAMTIVGSGALAFAGSGSTLTGSITPGTALISTVTGGSGGALSPTTGNVSVLGTSNQITSTGSGSSITMSLPSAITAPGSVTATTSLTATLGAITATNGNLVLNTAGNKIVSTSVASTTTAGANSFGKVTLVAGTATVSTTAVTASSLIVLFRMSVGSTGANPLGILSVGTITAGTSFVINAWSASNATSLATTDVSSIGWMIIN